METNVLIRIFDNHGRILLTREQKGCSQGSHEFHWDGSDSRGNHLPTGIYYCRIDIGSGGYAITRISYRNE